MVHGILAARLDAVPEATLSAQTVRPSAPSRVQQPASHYEEGWYASKRCGSIAQGNDGRDELERDLGGSQGGSL